MINLAKLAICTLALVNAASDMSCVSKCVGQGKRSSSVNPNSKLMDSNVGKNLKITSVDLNKRVLKIENKSRSVIDDEIMRLLLFSNI